MTSNELPHFSKANTQGIQKDTIYQNGEISVANKVLLHYCNYLTQSYPAWSAWCTIAHHVLSRSPQYTDVSIDATNHLISRKSSMWTSPEQNIKSSYDMQRRRFKSVWGNCVCKVLFSSLKYFRIRKEMFNFYAITEHLAMWTKVVLSFQRQN